jgi:hypothetical protein
MFVAATVLLFSSITAGVVGIVAADRAARESEQRWCGVVTTLDEAYSGAATSTRPQTTIGKKLAEEVHTLRLEFHC